MPNKNLSKIISTIFCLLLIFAMGVYSVSVIFDALRTAKTIDEKIAKSSGVNINKSNLDKAVKIIKEQEEPIPEQFWTGVEQASPSAQNLP